MISRRWIPGIALFALVWAGNAVADEQAVAPEEVTTGDVRIAMSSDYARLRVDGEEWETHEFLDNGRTLLIHGLDRTAEHVVSLTPVYPDLEGVEMTIAPAQWKLVTVAKRVRMWQVVEKVTFKKKAPAPAPTPAPSEPAPEE